MSCLKNFHFCKNQVHSQRQNQTAEPCFHQNPNPSAFGNRAALCGLVAMLFVFFAAFPVPGQTAAQKPTGRQTPAAIADGTAKIVSHADAAQMLRLVIGLKPPHPEEEQKFLDDLQDKTSPEFHHFFTADECNARSRKLLLQWSAVSQCCERLTQSGQRRSGLPHSQPQGMG